jgi:hypothetical protein
VNPNDDRNPFFNFSRSSSVNSRTYSAFMSHRMPYAQHLSKLSFGLLH